ncbi:MAG: hypothetical protein ACM3IJ_00185 [Candidatus Levyibacteriota bacterium]
MSKEQEKPIHTGSMQDVIMGDAAAIAAVGASDIIVANITGGVPQIDSDPAPVLSPDNPIMQLLQHERDFYECFVIAGLTHLGLEGVDYAQSRITKRRLPLKLKLGAGILLSFGLLIGAETDLGQGHMGTPDLKDIPAGVAGVVAYPGVDYFLRKRYFKSSIPTK